jgi:hypothetical protein
MSDNGIEAERAALATILKEEPWMSSTPEEVSGFKFYEVDVTGDGARRWTETMHTIIKSKVSGRHWRYEWERGLTEVQENEWPDFSDPTSIVEVEPYTETITVTKYRKKAQP